MNGTLIPLGGGDPIPLIKKRIVLGRREGCDVRLTHANISGEHCELAFDNDGAWIITDLDSTNGVKVNGVRVLKRRLRPGDDVTLARKHHFRIDYSLEGTSSFEEFEIPYDDSSAQMGGSKDPFVDDDAHRRRSRETADDAHTVFGTSLLERAGLERRKPGDTVRNTIYDEEPEEAPIANNGENRISLD